MNRVYRVILNRARGLLPFLPGEIALSSLPAVLIFFAGHPLIAIAIWAILLGLLVAWRRRDHDRADYARTWWRRRKTPEGFYTNERDFAASFYSDQDEEMR